jgi:hypothetical protein
VIGRDNGLSFEVGSANENWSFYTVSIPFISPFYILLFINIVHNYSIPVNCTYCTDQINQLTKSEVFSMAPLKTISTWCQKSKFEPWRSVSSPREAIIKTQQRYLTWTNFS